MELQTIVDRYADSIERIDRTARNPNPKYQPGVQPITETQIVPLIDKEWQDRYPHEVLSSATEVAYPTLKRTKIDHVLTTDSTDFEEPEWGIEVKRLQFVGDNGRRNDYQVAKVLSPYLKDRGLLHDALRLQGNAFTRRIAVVGYGFDYSEETLERARQCHSDAQALATLDEIQELVRTNGPLHNRPLVEFADAIIRLRGWTSGPRVEAKFEAWRHPAGGAGLVFGWEIRRPTREHDYDPRHPW